MISENRIVAELGDLDIKHGEVTVFYVFIARYLISHFFEKLI